MTFKHLKFAESSTMQAFEKMAKDKGLVKSEEITVKKASKSLDLNPSGNLLQNILKLSAGLRVQGFHKQANDLERKFLTFKQASTLYETSKETGDDLVHQAHPEGSHTIKDVEGDAVIETIVDAKKKIEEIVNKNPKGKLTNASTIFDMVKSVLAQSIPTVPEPQPRPDGINSNSVLPKGVTTESIFGKMPENRPMMIEPINKGTAANSTFIKSILIPPFNKLSAASEKLQQLKQLSSHDRISDVVEKAVNTYASFVSNIMKAYAVAITEATKFALTKEKDRMRTSGGDANSSLVKLQEVLPFLVKGNAAPLGLGNATSFDDLANIMNKHLNDIGNQLVTGLSPGFEFDEEDLTSLSQKALSLINEAAAEIKTR